MEKLTAGGLTFELRPAALERFYESMDLYQADRNVRAHNHRLLFHTVAKTFDAETGEELPGDWDAFWSRINLAHMGPLMSAIQRVNNIEDDAPAVCPHCGRSAAEPPAKKKELSSASAPPSAGTPGNTGQPSKPSGAPSAGALPPSGAGAGK